MGEEATGSGQFLIVEYMYIRTLLCVHPIAGHVVHCMPCRVWSVEVL